MERRHFEFRQLPPRVQTRADGRQSIVGYAAAFYDGTAGTQYDLGGRGGLRMIERIDRHAFDGAMSRSDDVRALFNHDPSLLLGRTSARTLKLEVDGKGLRYDIQLGDTSVARDVHEHIRRGDITGSSFAFRIDKESYTDERQGGEKVAVRRVESVTLYDVGPVTYPAYEATSAQARALNTRALEDFEREYKIRTESDSLAVRAILTGLAT